MYVAQIPIPLATAEQQYEIEQRVEAILTQKKADPEADVSEFEAEINQIVYSLYGLTDAEIANINESYCYIFMFEKLGHALVPDDIRDSCNQLVVSQCTGTNNRILQRPAWLHVAWLAYPLVFTVRSLAAESFAASL